MGLQIQVINASTIREIDAAFATFRRDRPDALLVGSGPLFTTGASNWPSWRRRYGLPAIYAGRELTEAGGLMSYGASQTDAIRQIGGLYRPHPQGAQSPQTCRSCSRPSSNWSSTRKPPRMLGLEVPPTLLARADEVIE